MTATLGLLAGIALGVGIGMLHCDLIQEAKHVKNLQIRLVIFLTSYNSFVNSNEEDKQNTPRKRSQPSHT